MDSNKISDVTLSCNRIIAGNHLIDFNEAQQEAQEIMMDGKPRERHPEHLLEESTTIEVFILQCFIIFFRCNALINISFSCCCLAMEIIL